MPLDLQEVFRRIDVANREDPNRERSGDHLEPKEWLYGVRMSARLSVFRPDATPELQVACRAQHLCRFRVPRAEYPTGREGYLRWRRDLGRMHAELLREILQESGADEAFVEKAASLVQKKRLRTDPEAQALEDVACLVFLEHYALAFAGQHDEAKVIDIVQKTWGKMSDAGHAAALALTLPDAVSAVVKKALA